jgi:arylformamidase
LSAVFRDYDQAALDAQYDQRAWAPNAEEVIARYGSASEVARKQLGEPRTLSYGPQELDVYGAASRVFVFVHGGAWRREMRRESAFAAPAVVAAGYSYVALGFSVGPIEAMVEQVSRALEWIHKNLSDNLLLCAHSSGAHLAACALTRLDFFRHALLVSGIYDLAPVRLSARNSYLRLDERLEHAYSPIRHAARIRCPVTVAWGEKESAEFVRQSGEFAAALGAPALVVPGVNHFEVIEQLSDQSSPLARSIAAQTRAGE